MTKIAKTPKLAAEMRERIATLSERERKVCELMYLGNSVKKIGELMFLAPSSISTYRLRVLRKLGLSNNAQLIITWHEGVALGEYRSAMYAAELGLGRAQS